MRTDYIPNADSELADWLAAFSTFVSSNFAAIGITAPQTAQIDDAAVAFATALATSDTAQNTAKSAVAAKDAQRMLTVNLIRGFVRVIQANPNVTNTQRQAMGIAERGLPPTPVGVPTTFPVLNVSSPARSTHLIDFVDSARTGNSKAKPAGVDAAAIYIKIGGTPPATGGECEFVAFDTRTPYTLEFTDPTEIGKMAYYMARWVNSKGEMGPWSATAALTIGGG